MLQQSYLLKSHSSSRDIYDPGWSKSSCLLPRLAGPDRGTGTGPDQTDFSAVRSQSKRPDRETVSIFGPDRTETFIAQAFINKLN